MAVALWALGDDEVELASWMDRHRMRPVGQPVRGVTGRARLMQKCVPATEDETPADD
jgi:hypothetical protein